MEYTVKFKSMQFEEDLYGEKAAGWQGLQFVVFPKCYSVSIEIQGG